MAAARSGEPPDPVSEYRVRARNLSRQSANRIHDDAVARTYGYAGGLVAGTTVWAYMTHPLVAAWGLEWLARATAHVRFLGPVYDGDEVSVRARGVGRSGGEAAGEIVTEVEAHTAREGLAATAVTGLAWGAPPPVPDPAAYPAAPLPPERAVATAERLARLDPLGSPPLDLEESELARYAEEIAEPLGLYRGREAVPHPGLLLQQANRALSENVALGPWVHVASDLSHCGLARAGERLSTRGRVARLFERKGHRYVELDVLVVADGARPILHVRHTAIWQLKVKGGRDG
ncbi:MAG: MaoC family dehydratase [Candidatus Rokubacteria bacterium]|nr:MaoC family dehydratase [Candidatus Rokubacteria bacterium]